MEFKSKSEEDKNCEDDIPLLEVRSPEKKVHTEGDAKQDEATSSTSSQKPILIIPSLPTTPLPPDTSANSSSASSVAVAGGVSLPLILSNTSAASTPSSLKSLSPVPPTPMTDEEKSKNSTIIVPKQSKKKNPSDQKKKQKSSVIQFSNPKGNGGSGQKIKVDISQAISSLLPLPISESPNPAITPKLDLPDLSLKQDSTEDESLHCDEKIGDSPELEKRTTSNTKASQDKQSVKVEAEEDLLKPLQVDESFDTSKSNLNFTLNEFGLIDVSKVIKEDVKKENVTASPRKDNVGRRIQDDNILCCEGCGCYGMAGEFVAQNSCSAACNRIILDKVREKQKKEKEALKQKQKREAKNAKKNGPNNESITSISLPKTSHYNENYSWHDVNGFNWQKYLDWVNAKAAPVNLFKPDPFPKAHKFSKLMKLEAVDPLNPSYICVVSVAEVAGARLRLHFDGYSDSFDFWENVNSENLFPVGFCQKNKQILSPPKGFTPNNFSWDSYLAVTKSVGAGDELFQNKLRLKSSTEGWRVGSKLEAADPDKPDLIHVATVSNVIENRVLIHFDGWHHNFDFWTSTTSTYLKPVGWCSDNKKTVTPPLGSKFTTSSFSWPSYLSSTSSQPVPSWAFKSSANNKDKAEFTAGMRLEAVDVRNPSLVRVASISAVEGRRVKIHYDGWPSDYDVWLDHQSGDIHPCGWAARTGHNLMSALTPEEIKYWAERAACVTPGCRGLGHVKGSRYTSHHSVSACPYAKHNIDNEDNLPDRLQDGDRIKDVVVKIEEDEKNVSVVPVVVGKTGRRRRKRKFFDDATAAAKSEDGDKKPKMERRESQESKTSGDRSDSRASGSTDSSGRLTEKNDQETQTGIEKVGNTFETEWEENVRKSVFQPGYLPQPYPVGLLPFNWAEHSKLLLGRQAIKTKDKAKTWSIEQVADFISDIPNIDHNYISDKLSKEEIDGESLLSLTQSDLTSILEIKLGPAIKIFNAITALKIKT